MNKELEFTELEKEILQELMNIAYGKGTAAIADIIDSFATLAIPQIDILTPENLIDYLSKDGYEKSKCYIATQVLNGDINGESLFMMDEESTKKLAIEFKLHTNIEDSILSSIVLEIANILSITTVGELAQSLKTEAYFEPPSIQLIGSLNAFDHSYFTNYQQIIAISTVLQFNEQNIHGKLMLLITDQSIEWLKMALERIAKEYF